MGFIFCFIITVWVGNIFWFGFRGVLGKAVPCIVIFDIIF